MGEIVWRRCLAVVATSAALAVGGVLLPAASASAAPMAHSATGYGHGGYGHGHGGYRHGY